jgi:hypothetical protein
LWRATGAAGNNATNNKQQTDKMKKQNIVSCFELQCAAAKQETVAELQARQASLEQSIVANSSKTDAGARLQLRADQAEVAEIQARLELAKSSDRLAALEASNIKRLETDADLAVARMVDAGTIAVRDTELQASWKSKFTSDPTLIPLVAGNATKTGVSGRTTPNATAVQLEAGAQVTGGFSVPNAMKRYFQLMSQNAKVDWRDTSDRSGSYRSKGQLALEAANIFKNDLLPCVGRWEHVPVAELGKAIGLQAGDYSDAANNVGILSGTLVLQRTLPAFAYKYPELLTMYTDFSDTPGVLNQTETTHIVVQPAVQKYDATTDTNGRPKGWYTVSNAVVKDVPITLTDYVGVPIVFNNQTLASTTRRLFDEQAQLAIKALAGYFVGMVTTLATTANFNAYAVAGTNGVVAGSLYPSYAKGLGEFSMGDLDTLDAIFTDGKVPEEDRGIMLTSKYYAKLRGDPRMSFYYAASAKDVQNGAGEFLTEARLPKISGFAPFKAPYLPQTNNVVSFAYQKAAIVLKSRLPQDFTQALGTMIPGSVTTVTDPDTKISIMLVQYVNLTSGYAEWRPEVMLGAAVGDNRAGLVGTSV